MLSAVIRKPLTNSASRLFSTAAIADNDVLVCSFARTPIGKMGGALAGFSAPQLGSLAITAAIDRCEGVDKGMFEEAFIGNVVSANIGQAPARQAVLLAGLDLDTPCTTVNKVCASGMKTAMFGALGIQAGYRDLVLAGGMESMSNIPFYLPGARTGYRLGHNNVLDGLLRDGLLDAFDNKHMGTCGELCAEQYSITREDQDEYAVNSYRRAAAAWDAGYYDDEVVPVIIPGKRNKPDVTFSRDEEVGDGNVDKAKMAALRPAFKKENGTVTAANASKINDGAAAMVIASGKLVKERGLKPLFRIKGFGDAAKEPKHFTTAPADAVPRALKHAGMQLSDVEYHEVNEAFSVVAIANAKILNLDLDRVNVHGGAVAMGHPIGVSGARILGTMYGVLKAKDATIGCASICNGGGGASAVIIERLS